jgi:hypothetical protein
MVHTARTANGCLVVIYVPADGSTTPRELTANLRGLRPGATARWFNPARDEAPREVGTGADVLRARTPGGNGTGTNRLGARDRSQRAGRTPR